MISRRTAMVAGGASVIVAAGGGVYLASRDKPEPPAPPSVDGQNHLLWRNWSGIAYAYPAVRSAPAVTTRSMQSSAPAVEAAVGGPTRLDVRFAPTARMSDITALLDAYQGTIVGNDKSGLFRLQFGSQIMTKDQQAGLIRRLENEKIVSMAVPAQ